MADSVFIPGDRHIGLVRVRDGWSCMVWLYQWTESELDRWHRYDQRKVFGTDAEAREHAEQFGRLEEALIPLVAQDLNAWCEDLAGTRDEVVTRGVTCPCSEAQLEALCQLIRAAEALARKAENEVPHG